MIAIMQKKKKTKSTGNIQKLRTENRRKAFFPRVTKSYLRF